MVERRRGRLAAACLLAAPAAVAHSPIEGIGDFYGGILHPALVPAHLLALISLGLLLGQRGLDTMRLGYAAFLPALIAGLAAAGAGVSINSLELWLLTGSLVCGLLVAARLPLPVNLSAVLAGTVGLAVGLDSSPDIASATRAAASLAGSGLGACVCLIFIGALAELPRRDWQRVAVRVVASWGAASALLVLSLRWVALA